MSTPFEIISSVTGSADVARQALESLAKGGFVCAPRNATEEMIEAGWAAAREEHVKEAWADMMDCVIVAQAKENACEANECCTPEMIDAGMDAYNKWHATPEGDTGPLSNMVKAVFVAMQKRQILKPFSTKDIEITPEMIEAATSYIEKEYRWFASRRKGLELIAWNIIDAALHDSVP